jgi:multidrug efflux pump subunit AcrA (membrane-fusion protein)
MKIVDPSSMVINATVSQVDAEGLRIGQKATVGIDAYPNLSLPAHVFSIGAISKPRMFRPNWVQDIAVRLKLDKMSPEVIPDLSASADIQLAAEKHAAVAPLGAIFREPSADPKRPLMQVAYVRNEASGWERREVELGFRNNLAAAVKSGLKPGDVVAAQRPPDQDKGKAEGEKGKK